MTNQAAATLSPGELEGQPLYRLRWTWLGLWALLTGFAAFEVVKHGFVNGSPVFASFLTATAVGAFIAPDLAFLIGISDQVEKGSISTRAVPFYNAAHRMAVALAFTIATASSVALFGPAFVGAFVAGLSWMAHISIDRAVGYGLRNPDGSRDLQTPGAVAKVKVRDDEPLVTDGPFIDSKEQIGRFAVLANAGRDAAIS